MVMFLERVALPHTNKLGLLVRRRVIQYGVYVVYMLVIISVAKILQTICATKTIPTNDMGQGVCPVQFSGVDVHDTYNGSVEFVLYRAIGNDLPPRHAIGQSYKNVKFILENEPELLGLERRWILNRIFNPMEEQRIIRLLEVYKQKYEILSLNLTHVAQIPLHHEGYSEHDVIRRRSRNYGTLLQKEMYRATLIDHLYRDKNLYIINNNGARNAALDSGVKDGFKWIMPWDGNIFLTAAAWKEMRQTIYSATKDVKYFHVPMARLQNNTDLFDSNFCPMAVEEPQLIFRNDALERFNMNKRYGRRPKVDILLRLGVQGPWDNYVKASTPYFEETTTYSVSKDVGVSGVPSASWVARLYSGSGAQEVATKDLRKLARCYGVNTILDEVDVKAAVKLYGLRKEMMSIYNLTVLRAERAAYLDYPKENPELVELVGKLQVCARESMHFATVPRSTISGGPVAVNISVYDKQTEILPPGRLGPFFRNSTCLALAWFFTQTPEFASKAAMLFSSFFLEDDTKIRPIEVVDAMFGEADENGKIQNLSVVGSIEMKDLCYFLDAVQLVAQSGKLTEEELQSIRKWFGEYSELVLRRAEGYMIGTQGSEDGFEYRAFGPRGVFYDLQMSTVGIFSGNLTLYMHYAKHAKARLHHQFAYKTNPRPINDKNTFIGTMRVGEKEELVTSAPFVARQLNAWFLLARVSRLGGFDLHKYTDSVRPLRNALLFNQVGFKRQYLQEQSDLTPEMKEVSESTMNQILSNITSDVSTGMLLSYYLALKEFPELAKQMDPHSARVPLYKSDPTANEGLGVHPFWNLGLSDQFLMRGQ